MKLTIAKTAGFCMGVRRAVEMVLDAPKKHDEPIYTYGPLIHNPQVLDLLAERGIRVLSEIPAQGTGTVLIRAHGVPPDTADRLRAAGFEVIDATCPRVIKVQTIIARHTRNDYATIIVGDRDHPEVAGLLGYAAGRGVVVNQMADLETLPAFAHAIIVAQTTQNKAFFTTVRQWAANHHPHYKLFDTICDSTAKRQQEIQQLASTVDAVVVVGGHNSGNTQRLAEIVQEAGKPAFHVETEAELDPAVLSTRRRIGVTAGASTPNWIIKRVCRRLESLSIQRAAGWRNRLFKVQQTLLRSNTYVALGAGAFCFACAALQALPRTLPYVLVAVLYVQSMHMLNNLTGYREDRFNDPPRAHFYSRYQIVLGILAVLSGACGLMTAFTLGQGPFVILLVMSALGLSYNLRLLPPGLGRFRRIKDIPGSKTVLIALAWGVVTAAFPALSQQGWTPLATLTVFAFAALIVFVRTAFFDILDVQGDRLVGKETIPILLGEVRTQKLLRAGLALSFLILLMATALGWVRPLGYLMLLCPVFLGIVMAVHGRGRIHPGVRLEFLVESHFILAGLLALVWTVVAG